MAYQTYTTDAIVCGNRERGASDRMFWLFTEDAGMILARAKSVRELRSKLRYGLQDFSCTNVSLVRGAYDWRVTGVEPGGNLFTASTSREGRASVLRAVRLLRRLLPGEEAHPALFRSVYEGLLHLATLTPGDTLAEELFTLRVLHQLGYIASTKDLHEALHAKTLQDAKTALRAPHLKAHIHRLLEEAMSATQL